MEDEQKVVCCCLYGGFMHLRRGSFANRWAAKCDALLFPSGHVRCIKADLSGDIQPAVTLRRWGHSGMYRFRVQVPAIFANSSSSLLCPPLFSS